MEENKKQNRDSQPKSSRFISLVVTILTIILLGLVLTLIVKKVMEPQNSSQVVDKSPINLNENKVTNTKTHAIPSQKANKQDLSINIAQSASFLKRASDPQNPEFWYNKPLPKLKNPQIIVSKSKFTLSVYDQGKLVKVYDAAIGSNLVDKQIEGDKATPEGEFYICIKKGRKQTKFYRSMGLSYPNIEDAKRGLKNKLISRSQYNKIVYAITRKRMPPWNTKLGGAIMIHGCRGGGRNTGNTRIKARSTLGCIALENEDVLELFRKLKVGTKVIVRK